MNELIANVKAAIEEAIANGEEDIAEQLKIEAYRLGIGI
jgi:hypothetical protein